MAHDNKPFDAPVTLRWAGEPLVVASTRQAAMLLADVDWPRRGDLHEQALDAALKVLDGHRSTVDARDGLVAAAREAEILVVA